MKSISRMYWRVERRSKRCLLYISCTSEAYVLARVEKSHPIPLIEGICPLCEGTMIRVVVDGLSTLTDHHDGSACVTSFKS